MHYMLSLESLCFSLDGEKVPSALLCNANAQHYILTLSILQGMGSPFAYDLLSEGRTIGPMMFLDALSLMSVPFLPWVGSPAM